MPRRKVVIWIAIALAGGFLAKAVTASIRCPLRLDLRCPIGTIDTLGREIWIGYINVSNETSEVVYFDIDRSTGVEAKVGNRWFVREGPAGTSIGGLGATRGGLRPGRQVDLCTLLPRLTESVRVNVKYAPSCLRLKYALPWVVARIDRRPASAGNWAVRLWGWFPDSPYGASSWRQSTIELPIPNNESHNDSLQRMPR
jgi:hypothetical protein